jgi:hypothetical protein
MAKHLSDLERELAKDLVRANELSAHYRKVIAQAVKAIDQKRVDAARQLLLGVL